MAKSNKKQSQKVHKELDGFDIKINSNGEVETSIPIDELNNFLDKHTEDKKFKNIDVKRKKTNK